MLSTRKLAVRFLEQNIPKTKESVGIFSESHLMQMKTDFFSSYSAMESFADYIVQRNRTNELRKQIQADRQAFDAEMNSKECQLENWYAEELERLRISWQTTKETMTNEFQRLQLELAQREKNNLVAFEEYIRESETLGKIIQQQKEYLEENRKFINKVSEQFSQRKEFIKYCEIERKTLEKINNFLKYMV